MPKVAFLGLMHFRVTLPRAVLGRTRCSNQRRIEDGTGLEQQAFARKHGIHGFQYLLSKAMGFEQVMEAQDVGTPSLALGFVRLN